VRTEATGILAARTLRGGGSRPSSGQPAGV